MLVSSFKRDCEALGDLMVGGEQWSKMEHPPSPAKPVLLCDLGVINVMSRILSQLVYAIKLNSLVFCSSKLHLKLSEIPS
jgi:hypothetical protein